MALNHYREGFTIYIKIYLISSCEPLMQTIDRGFRSINSIYSYIPYFSENANFKRFFAIQPVNRIVTG